MTLEKAVHITRGAHATYHLRNDGQTLATLDQFNDGRWIVWKAGSKSRPFSNLTAALCAIAAIEAKKMAVTS